MSADMDVVRCTGCGCWVETYSPGESYKAVGRDTYCIPCTEDMKWCPCGEFIGYDKTDVCLPGVCSESCAADARADNAYCLACAMDMDDFPADPEMQKYPTPSDR